MALGVAREHERALCTFADVRRAPDRRGLRGIELCEGVVQGPRWMTSMNAHVWVSEGRERTAVIRGTLDEELRAPTADSAVANANCCTRAI